MQSLINKIRNLFFKKFSFRVVSRSYYEGVSEAYSEAFSLRLALSEKEAEVKQLEEKVAQLSTQLNKGDWDIVADMPDPAPTDSRSYAEYVSKVAGFHSDVLHEKMRHTISMAYKILEESSDEKLNERIKGTIYAFREISRWGESCTNKHMEVTRKEEDESDDSFSSSKIISDLLED